MISGRLSELVVETRAPANAVETVRHGEDRSVVDETCAAFLRSFGGLALWITADDIEQVDGTDVAAWPARIGTAPTQATPGLRPVYDAQGLNGRPSVFFSSAGRALLTEQLLDAYTCTVGVVSHSEDTTGTAIRTIWEQTESWATQNGHTIGYNTNPGEGLTSVAYSGSGGGGANYLVGEDTELDGVDVCMIGSQDRLFTGPQGGFEVTVDGALEGRVAAAADISGSTYQPGAGSWIGSRNNGTSRALDGWIRELVVYNDWLATLPEKVLMTRALMFRSGLL